MTDSEYVTDAPQQYEGDVYVAEAVPVTIEGGEHRTAEYGSCMTWVIPQTTAGLPVQLLTRKYRRYEAYIQVVALGGATSVVFNSRQEPLQGTLPQGYTVTAVGILPPWKNQQPLYAIAVGGGPAQISVMDNTFAETEAERHEHPWG